MSKRERVGSNYLLQFVLAALAGLSVIIAGTVEQRDMALANAGPVTESSPANLVAGLLESLGESNYPDTFIGTDATDAANVTIYTTASAGPLMADAEGVANDNGVTLTQVVGARSLQDLLTTTNTIADNVDPIASAGYNLSYWGPDPQTDTVEVTLAPSPAPHPTNQEYMSEAQAELDSIVGMGDSLVVGVDSQLVSYSDPGTCSLNRDDEIFGCQFLGGDSITGNQSPYSVCNDSWVAKVVSTGKEGVLTAGHCGTGSFNFSFGNEIYLGSAFDRKIGGTVQHDFELIETTEDPAIWKDWSAHSYSTSGYANAGKGDTISVNGDYYGEQTNVPVMHSRQCATFTDKHDDPQRWTVCGVAIATSDHPICHPGDSGGPSYVRNGDGTVRPEGIIVGGTVPDNMTCLVESWYHMSHYGGIDLVTS